MATETIKWTAKKIGNAENPGVFDNGDGSLTSCYESPDWPGVTKCEWTSYAGRGEDRVWYEADSAPQYAFGTPGQAAALEREIRAQQAEMQRREAEAAERRAQWVRLADGQVKTLVANHLLVEADPRVSRHSDQAIADKIAATRIVWSDRETPKGEVLARAGARLFRVVLPHPLDHRSGKVSEVLD